MKTKTTEDSTPRFLYRPWRIDSTLMVVRHLIVQEGPKRIVVQRAPYDQLSEEFHRTQPLVYVEQDRMERQGEVRKWLDPEFGTNHSCPLGKLYAVKFNARLALRRWIGHLRGLIDTNPGSLNLPLTEAILLAQEAYSRELKSSLRSALSRRKAIQGPLSLQDTSMPQEDQAPLLRYTYHGGPFDGQVEEHPGDPDLEDPYSAYGITWLRGESGKELAHLYDRTDEYTAMGFRIYQYGGVVSYELDQDKLRLF